VRDLDAGSAGWGNDQSGLPPVRRSWRKTTARKSRGPALLAGTVSRLLVQEAHRDEALLLARSDSSGWHIGDGQQWMKQLSARKRAARHVTAPSDDVRSSAKEWPTHVGDDDQRPPAPSALHVVSMATGNQGGARDRVTVLGG
jgi:hypothetical protein